MARRLIAGALFGGAAGALELVPMVLQRTAMDVNLWTFFFWVVTGMMLFTSALDIPPIGKGIVVALLLLLPNIFVIGWSDRASLVPVVIMTVVFGGLLGFASGRQPRGASALEE